MGLASNQARLNVLTARKADLEYRLMTLTNQEQDLAVREANLVAEKSTAYQAFVNEVANNDKDAAVDFKTTAAYIDYENAMAMLEVASNNLDMQKGKAETEYQAISAEEEEIGKLVDNNIKTSIKLFQQKLKKI